MEHQYFAEAEEGNMDHHQQLPEIIRKQQNKEKKRVRQEQVRVLESHFGFNNKLDPERKSQLAAELGVPPRQVAIWFQNKRAREKIQGLEVEHRGMQLQLESLLDENERLKEEAKSLKLELNKIKGAFSTSTSGDEVGSLVPRDFSGRDFYASPFGTAGPFVGHGGYEFFG